MTTLLDTIAQALTEMGDAIGPGIYAEAIAIARAIPPETRDQLEVGLLLAEVERRLEPNGLNWDAWRNHGAYVVEGLNEAGAPDVISGAPTLHAALTALYRKAWRARHRGAAA